MAQLRFLHGFGVLEYRHFFILHQFYFGIIYDVLYDVLQPKASREVF